MAEGATLPGSTPADTVVQGDASLTSPFGDFGAATESASRLSQGDVGTQSDEARRANQDDARTHGTNIQLATRTESAFSCRRWYRLTGKSIRPDYELTHILPSMRFPSTAPARPQNPSTWTKSRGSETQSFSPASPRDRARFNTSRPSTHQGIYGMASPPMSSSKWSNSDGYPFDAQRMQQLTKRVYMTKASTVKRRKEQEKKALEHHIYLPAVAKTLKMFHSPRQNNTLAQDLPLEYESGKSTESRPTGKAKYAAPIGANLLSSQIKTLQEELARQTTQDASGSHGTSSASPPALWCPQPPRTASNALYRPSRFAQAPRNDPSIQSSPISSNDGNCAATSLLFSDSNSSQQEISKFHYVAVPPGGGSDSRSSTSSLETHIFAVLEGCDLNNSSRMCSSGDLRFGLASEDDDYLALLQAIESAALEKQDMLFQNGSASENSQPSLTPSSEMSSIADSDPEVAVLEVVKPADSGNEIPSGSSTETGGDLSSGGEAVQPESPSDGQHFGVEKIHARAIDCGSKWCTSD